MKHSILFALLILMAFPSLAQLEKKPLAVTVNGGYGFIVPHRSTIKHLVTGHVPSLEVGVERPTDGRRGWHKHYNFPTVGFSIARANLGNNARLGAATAGYLYLKFPLRSKSKVGLDFRVGSGIGYVDKPFDQQNNHKNIAIGSHINWAVNLAMHAKFNLQERLQVHSGLSLTHFSNAATKIPNLGFNIPMLNVGATYTIHLPKIRYGEHILNKPHEKETQLFLTGAAGLKENQPSGGGKFFGYGLSLLYLNAYSPKASWGANFDIFYNTSLIPRYEANNGELESDLQIIQPGVMLHHSWRAGRMHLLVGQGVYLATKFKGDGRLYNRLGVRYEATSKLLVLAHLKAHGTKADYFEFGLGYRIK